MDIPFSFILFFFLYLSGKRARLSIQDSMNEDERDSDSGTEARLSVKERSSRSRSRSRSHSASRTHASGSSGHGITTETESIGGVRKRENSVNDSEDGSPDPGTPSSAHTPPLTPVSLTPQRVDTPAPENLSLRKTSSPVVQTASHQTVLQPVDLVQQRHSPPANSLAVAAAAAAHFSPYAPLYGPASSLYCSPALYQHHQQQQHHHHHHQQQQQHEARDIQMQMQMHMQSIQQPCGIQVQQGQAGHQQQRSPVDVLLRVFPGRRRADVEALLHRCKGLHLFYLFLLVNFLLILD